MKCAIVPVKNADSVLKRMFSIDMVDREHKITKAGMNLAVPVSDTRLKDLQYIECDPPDRVAGMSPVRRIKLDLLKKGHEGIAIPERWVRYGDSIVFRSDGMNEKLVAQEFQELFGIKSVYKVTGRVTGMFRTPSVELIAGPGGDTTHLENGIRFVFDPEKIMFSPGNVSERTSVSKLRLIKGRILDMFCGIGYFTLPLAMYSGSSDITAVDINPEAVRYLDMSARLNHLEKSITSAVGDSFSIQHQGNFDLVVMGNFRSIELLGKALGYTAPGGRVILHHLVSTDELHSYIKHIEEMAEKDGHDVRIVDSHRVKSYSPRVYHFSTTLMKG